MMSIRSASRVGCTIRLDIVPTTVRGRHQTLATQTKILSSPSRQRLRQAIAKQSTALQIYRTISSEATAREPTMRRTSKRSKKNNTRDHGIEKAWTQPQSADPDPLVL